MSLKQIRPDKRFLAEKRRILARAVKSALANQGDDFAGFVLVTWDNRGNANSSYYADTGPIGESLLPTYTHDVLNRHVAVVTVQNSDSYRLPGGVD